MKDPRLETNRDWELAQTQSSERAGTAFRELGDPLSLLRALAHSLEEGDAAGSDDDPPELPPALVDDVERFLRGLDGLGEASWFGIASALAISASALPSSEGLQSASERLGLARAPWWATTVFDETCVATIRSQPLDVQDRWLRALNTPPLSPAQPSPPAGPISVYQPAAQWSIVDPFSLWDEGGVAIEMVAKHAPTRVLRLWNAERWFEAVDAWDDGRLTFGAIWGDHVRHDADAIILWLRAAAPAFDANGQWTGRTAAVVLTYEVLEHARALVGVARTAWIRSGGDLANRSPTADQLLDVELPAFFSRAWDVLLARSDGLALAAALHSHLSAPPGPNVARTQFAVEPVASRTLAHAMAAHGARVADLRGLWLARSEMRRREPNRARADHGSFICALSSAVDVLAAAHESDDDLLQWVAEGLVPLDGDWRWFADVGAIDGMLGRLADLLTVADGALARCEELYDRLEPERRRSEFGGQYPGDEAHASSAIVVALILRLIVHKQAGVSGTSPEPSLVEAAERTFLRAVRLALVSSPSLETGISARSALVSAIAVRAVVDPASIGASLRIVLSDPGLAAATVANLVPALGRASVERAVEDQGLTFAEFQRRAEEWALATDLPRDKSALQALSIAMKGTAETSSEASC